jgi:hypothetical protein
MSIPLARMDAIGASGQVRIDCLAYGSRRFAALAVVDVGRCAQSRSGSVHCCLRLTRPRPAYADELNLFLCSFFFVLCAVAGGSQPLCAGEQGQL